ncbi:hypothetical protein Tco_1158710, partial [Tanacetum coccineum]
SSSSYADDVMFFFFFNQSNSPQLDNEDLEQIDTDNLNFNGKETGTKEPGNKNGDNTRRVVLVETPANALVVTDEMGYDWSFQAKEGPTYFALMAHLSSGSSSSSSSNTKVRDNSITKLKNQLAEALREKDDLKLKLEKFETSSMKLTKLINSQISVNNKSGVGFDSQMNENELHDCHLNKSEVFESASDSSVNEIEEENNQVNDRFKKVEGYHAVPPPYTGNYMPSRPDLSFAGLDDFVYKTNVSKTISSVPRNESTTSKSSKDSLEQPKDCNPQNTLQDQGIFDSGCSRHMIGNKSYLTDYQDIDGGFVAFAGSIETNVNAGKAGHEKASDHEYILLPIMLSYSPLSSSSQSIDNKDVDEVPRK